MTRLSHLLFVVPCLFLVACGAGAQEPAVEMDGAMAEFARLDLFSGTVLVARGGDVVYAKAFGEANKDHRVANILETKFNIGSIGKTFTGVAIMQLMEQGKIELAAPVSRYLDGFPYGDSIRVHHLLSHTSGMFNYMAHPEFRARMSGLRSIDDWLPLIYDQELPRPPGMGCGLRITDYGLPRPPDWTRSWARVPVELPFGGACLGRHPERRLGGIAGKAKSKDPVAPRSIYLMERSCPDVGSGRDGILRLRKQSALLTATCSQ